MRWNSGGGGEAVDWSRLRFPVNEARAPSGREGRNRVPQGAGRQGGGSQDFHLLHSIISTTDTDRLP